MTEAVRQRTVRGPDYAVGMFVCPPGSVRWGEENRIQEGPLFVFPSVPVEIAHEGADFRVADANQVVFYNDAQVYRRRRLDARGDRCMFFGLGAQDVKDILTDAGLGSTEDPRAPFEIFFASGSPQAFFWHLALSRYVFQNEARDDLFVHERLLTLLREAVAAVPASARSGPVRSHRQVRAAVVETQRQLARRYDENVSLADLGAAVGLSSFHLARQFRAQIGVSVHTYRERLRVAGGMARLMDGQRLVDVALDVGYSSHSHFTRAFRKVMGQSPSQVRHWLKTAQRDLLGVVREWNLS